jgi:hypothetical protein
MLYNRPAHLTRPVVSHEILQGLMWFECCGISTDHFVVWRLFCAYKFVK